MLAGGYYGAIGVGRILSGFVTHRIGLDWLIRFSMLAVLAGSLLFAFAPADWSLAIIGLGLAPIFPCLMSRTPQRLGAEYATHAIGFQVSAGMLGAALMPSIAGLLVERLGLEFVAQFAVLLATLLLTTRELLLYVASLRSLRRQS
jgi:MFS family permease